MVVNCEIIPNLEQIIKFKTKKDTDETNVKGKFELPVATSSGYTKPGEIQTICAMNFLMKSYYDVQRHL